MAGDLSPVPLHVALQHMQGPFRWGTCDCCTAASAAFAAFWSVPDPLDAIRDEIRSQRAAMRFLSRHGGLARAIGPVLSAAGLVRGPAGPGALGVVRVEGRDVGAFAIGAGFWAVRSEGGVTFRRDDDAEGWLWPR